MNSFDIELSLIQRPWFPVLTAAKFTVSSQFSSKMKLLNQKAITESDTELFKDCLKNCLDNIR